MYYVFTLDITMFEKRLFKENKNEVDTSILWNRILVTY